MTAHARHPSRRLLACLLAGLALPAGAIGLGDLSVHSALGEPLDATVALAPEEDARPVPACFSLARARAGGLPAIPRATFAVEPDGGGWRLRIRTRAAVDEPASQLRLNAACEGRDATSRDYEVLLDPRAAQAPPPALRALPGDTLASLARAIYPKRRAVREAYVQALRAANPALAGLGADEPIPPDTAVVLPDLRRFSMSLAVSPPAPRPALPVVKAQAQPAPADTPPPKAPPRAAPPKQSPATPPPAKTGAAAKPAPPPAKAETAAKPESLPPAKAAAPAKADASAPAPAPSKGGQFVLRLSSPEVDLARSRGIDDRTRAQLRERLLILDADDQVAALLSMRNSLKQLESRVAELQLKLSTLPPTPLPAAKPAPAASAPAPAPTPAAERVAAPAPSPAPERAPPPAPPPVPETAPAPPPPPVAATTPSPERIAPPPAKPAKPATSAPAAPVAPPKDSGDFLSWLLWAIFATFLAALAAVGWSEFSRHRRKAPAAAPASVPASTQPPSRTSALAEAEALMGGGASARPAEAGHRVIAESDASLATSVPGADPVVLRRRYIEERFPEIASGTIVLKDPDSVVKAARLFYEDGAIARAIELLQYTVEEMPASMKPWLALFEIFRLEGLSGEFAELAGRFRGHHGASDNWRKVQYIGRELDPGNALYRDAPFNNLETIGPAAAKKQASITFDPFAENWLNAPMDFTTDALAASLRAGLLADAGVRDSDLVADPMPALKNVEMFNVA